MPHLDLMNIQTPEEQLKDLVENYYQDMNSNHIEELPNYLSSDVENWYGAKDQSTDQLSKTPKITVALIPIQQQILTGTLSPLLNNQMTII